MSDASLEPPVVDPDNVQETVCVGKFNVSVVPPLAYMTFTHVRPQAGPLLDKGEIKFESVVKARIVTTFDTLVSLRDILNRVIKDQPAPEIAVGGPSKLN